MIIPTYLRGNRPVPAATRRPVSAARPNPPQTPCGRNIDYDPRNREPAAKLDLHMQHATHRPRWNLLGRLILVLLALAGGTAVTLLIERSAAPGDDSKPPAAASEAPKNAGKAAAAGHSPTLAKLAAGELPIVDLTWPLNDKSAYWPGENYRPFKLETIATLEKDGVLSKAFFTPEHLGTHLDAPNHFEAGRPSVDKIPPADLFAEGVVVDVRGPVSGDEDYQVSPADLKAFEEAQGRIPDRAVVLAYTGWSKFWDNPTRYQNRDVRDRLHFPGFSPEAVEFLIRERNVKGIGIDTLSVDPGNSRDFPVHHLLGKADRYGLENVAHLDRLPPRGFFLVVAPLAIESGSGSPIRLLAVLAKALAEN